MTPMTSTPSQQRFASRRRQRGSVFVEYIVLFALVAIVVAAGLVSLGPKVVKNYSGQREALYQSAP